MKIQESGEMYLETIYILSLKKSFVISLDIAEYMNFSKPSVSRAMSILKQNELINIDTKGYISLTEKGLDIAKRIYERHIILTNILESIGVSKDTAEKDACKIEHDISSETFDAIKNHLNKK